ncbi:MAG: hypothetical protein LLG01_00685 [Planctomycetaceae bacterium]|nr:hypothetical protein [Planctomycetaceae bacterium]
MELRTHKTLSDDQQTELMAQLAEWRGVADSGCKDALEQMTKCDDFNNGDQWDYSTKKDLEDQGKYVATIPMIRPQVNQLVGNVVSNPKDITIVNVHGGMKAVADLKSAQLKHALEINDAVNLMVQWFQRGVITSRSYLAWFADYTRDPVNGNLTIRHLPELNCLWDPTCRNYDLNGTCGGGDAAKFFFFDDWVDQDWADKRWPEATSNFSQTAGQPSLFGRMYNGVTQFLYGLVGKSTERLRQRSGLSDADYSATRYRLQHCWWIAHEECWYWYDTRRSQLDPLILISRKDISRARKTTERHPDVYRMVRSTVRVMHHTLSIGSQFLEDWVDEFNLAQANLSAYPVVPFYPAHAWGRAAGVVDDMIGPQEALNWMRSLIVNTAKLGPNSGWKIGKDIDGYSAVLREHSGEAAQVIDLSKCGNFAERIEPPQINPGLVNTEQNSKLEIREVSNIRTEAPEQDTAQMSGRAILAKQANSQTGVAPSLANFDWSLKLFGKVGNNIITCSGVYGDDEIKAIVEDGRLLDDNLLHEARVMVCAAIGAEMPQEPPVPNPAMFETAPPNVKVAMGQLYVQEKEQYELALQEIDRFARPMAIQALIDAARNPIAGTYHCTVNLSPYGVTARLQQMANTIEGNEILIKNGYLPLPERDVIEAMDLPHKDRLLRERGYA